MYQLNIHCDRKSEFWALAWKVRIFVKNLRKLRNLKNSRPKNDCRIPNILVRLKTSEVVKRIPNMSNFGVRCFVCV